MNIFEYSRTDAKITQRINIYHSSSPITILWIPSLMDRDIKIQKQAKFAFGLLQVGQNLFRIEREAFAPLI